MFVRNETNLGVIDTLALGFGAIARRAWVLIIPVALDLSLWWGPKLSLGPFLGQPLQIALLPADAQSRYLEAVQGVNLAALLSAGVLGTPNLVPSLTSPSPLGWGVIEIERGEVLIGLLVLLSLTGLLLGTLYLGLIAHILRKEGSGWGKQLSRYMLTSVRILAYLALVVGAIGVLALFFVPLILFASMFSRELAGLLLAGLLVFLIWAGFYLFFALPAILVDEVGPLRAMWSSFLVVRYHFGSSLLFVGLALLIARGLFEVWRALATTPWGIALGILGNAYIGSGLIAASLIFYRDRLQRTVRQLGPRRLPQL